MPPSCELEAGGASQGPKFFDEGIFGGLVRLSSESGRTTIKWNWHRGAQARCFARRQISDRACSLTASASFYAVGTLGPIDGGVRTT